MSEETPSTTALAIKQDNGKPALFNPAIFDQIWRASKLFASSDLVPVAYKGKPENCFIAIEMADRMGISPFAMLQSLVIIQGKPSMEAKLIIAMVNDSGIFENPLEYDIVGDDPHAQDYKVRAFATMKKTGKLCQGPWITYQMVKGEGWLDKGGSKWKTMPSIMFMYRAASFFAKVYCPNITMGMQTREEMEDVKTIDVTPEQPKPAPPALVAPVDPPTTTAPAMVAPLVVDGEAVDVTTGECTATSASSPPPARLRGQPSPGRQRRTKEEMEEDRLADEADETAQAAPVAEENPPYPADTAEPAQPEAVAEPASEPEPVAEAETDTEPAEACGDLF